MKRKWPGALLLIGVIVLVAVVIPLTLFSTISGAFVPPVTGTDAARVPELPYANVAASEQPGAGEAPPAVEPPDANTALGRDGEGAGAIQGDAIVEALLAGYRNRHPEPPSAPGRLHPQEGVPVEFCEMALSMLLGEESADEFFKLLSHPDASVRRAVVEGLAAAQNALREEGAPAMLGLLATTAGEERERLVRVAVEALIADTEAGLSSNVPMVLMYLGEYARPAIPHLVWASRNHTDPRTRVCAMGAVYTLAPDSDLTRTLISERLMDADGGVRLQALGAWALRPLAEYARDSGRDSPLYLTRPQGDTPDEPALELDTPTQKAAFARAM